MIMPLFAIKEKGTKRLIRTVEGYYKAQKMMRLSNTECYLVEIYSPTSEEAK